MIIPFWYPRLLGSQERVNIVNLFVDEIKLKGAIGAHVEAYDCPHISEHYIRKSINIEYKIKQPGL